MSTTLATDEPLLVSRDRAAQMLGGVDIKTLDAMAQRGDLKAVRVGKRRVMYPVQELRAFVERSKNARG